MTNVLFTVLHSKSIDCKNQLLLVLYFMKLSLASVIQYVRSLRYIYKPASAHICTLVPTLVRWY